LAALRSNSNKEQGTRNTQQVRTTEGAALTRISLAT
jgi:hypothetical protein